MVEKYYSNFKFPLTLLAAFGTTFTIVYNFIQNTAINYYWYNIISEFITILLFLTTFLILSIFIEVCYEITLNNNLKEMASALYAMVFFGGPFLFVYVFFFQEIDIIQLSLIIFLYFIFITLVGGKIDEQSISIPNNIFIALLIIVFIFSWTFIFQFFLSASLFQGFHGDIKVSMNNVYNKNDTQIPVLFHVTGPNNYLLINLSKSNSENNLTQIDALKLEPEQTEKTIFGDRMLGNSWDYGKYIVFINTSNMSEGYYQLTSKRYGDEKTRRYGFYLLK
ncbi:hypothetical protein FLAV_02170 [Flavobacteriales bacterium]|nr:hypothetical protein FLAV_02170 [Flavobacteriales bacterium]